MSELYRLKNLQFFRDKKLVLDIENLKIEESKIIGVFGPNGSGKSTLFSILSFIEKPTSGELYFQGIESRKLEFANRQKVVILPQNPYLLKRRVFDNVAYGLLLRNDKDNLERRVIEALAQVGLEESFKNRKWSELSGGEAQRVALATRLILKPKVLILDEPTSAVDTNSAQLIKEAIFIAKQKWNTSIIISSHDHNWLNHACDEKIALFQGKVIESGSINLLFAPWEKESNGNLLKKFFDGQCLTFENSFSKKRDSIVMINSDDIFIYKENKNNSLKGVVISIHKEPKKDDMIVVLSIGGINFNSKIKKNILEKMFILPGETVDVVIDTKKVLWI